MLQGSFLNWMFSAFCIAWPKLQTMGEWFLDLRCDLLPDVCLATRALGHPVIAFNEHSDRNAAMSDNATAGTL